MKIKIENKFFNHFSNLTLKFNLDTFASVFSFDARFDPFNVEHQKIFKPLTYPKIEIFSNDMDLLLTGNIVNNSFISTKTPQLVSFSGYTKSGILEDVTIPDSVYPLEKNDQSLTEISTQLLQPFGISQVIESNVANKMNLIYEKAVAQPTQSVASFLTQLASQRNIVIGHTKKGDVYYFKAFIGSKPVRSYDESNLLSSKMAINGRAFHSDITVRRQPSDENVGVSTVDGVKNPNVEQIRSVCKILSSGDDTSTIEAAQNVLAAELRGIQLALELPKIDYELLCGQIIEFINPELFIYKKQKFVINEIIYNEDSGEDTMTINCLTPEAFTGGIPTNIFEIE
jgi:prophage tail gpP-like protein